jgi:hypothetical protein
VAKGQDGQTRTMWNGGMGLVLRGKTVKKEEGYTRATLQRTQCDSECSQIRGDSKQDNRFYDRDTLFEGC